jgi:prepilin-type N-terminal cleavage/methylation domain-containing protein
MKIRRAKLTKGFTLVELMVALIVTGIIMSAIATLAFAFTTANDASSDSDRKQAQVRYASLKLSEMIRQSKLVCATVDNSIVLWKADDNPKNDEIDLFELTYIDAGSNRDSLKIIEFSSYPTWISDWWDHLKVVYDQGLEIWALGLDSVKERLFSDCETTEIEVIAGCSNVQFSFDNPDEPSKSRFVNISFDLTENGEVRQYHIDSAIRCWAGNQISADGRGIIDDDD